MITRQTISEEIERLSSLKILVETYESISASTIRRIRSAVLSNRAFQDGLREIFAELKIFWKKQNMEIKNTPEVLVFLSANTGLYGEIVSKTFELFKEDARKMPRAQLVVVGRVGQLLGTKELGDRQFKYFDFPDVHIDAEILGEIAKYLSAYKRVLIYHGSFQNLLNQKPVAFDLYGTDIFKETASGAKVFYLFEPSLKEIYSFFEKEIFASLTEQAFQESRLAKVASRLLVLDRASSNIEEASKNVFSQKRKVDHMRFNKKQLNSLTAILNL